MATLGTPHCLLSAATFVGLLAAASLSACAQAAYSEPPPAYHPFVSDVPDGMRFVQPELFTGCVGPVQPAIVDFQGPTKVPVWQCLEQCPAGSDYVSEIRPNAREAAGPVFKVVPTCMLSCRPGRHRHAYFAFDARPNCEDGAGSAAQRAAADAELRRREREHASEVEEAMRVNDAVLGPVRACLRRLEEATVPWTLEQIVEYDRCSSGLAPLRRDPDEQLDSRVAVVDEEIDALRAPAEESKRSIGYRGPSRRGHGPAPSSRATRLRGCALSCEATWQCATDCVHLPEGGCNACNERLATCKASCLQSEEAR